MKKKYKRISYVFLIAAILACCNLRLQGATPLPEINVSGQVMDESNNALPGVNVVVKGTSRGTSTDAQGKYTITVPDANAVLVFSFIGYSTKEVQVGTQSVINVSMEVESNILNEIVVVGYGVQKKSSVTGAVSSVSSKEIAALPVPSVAAALQGRVAGVFVTNNGGPGTNAIVRIRGIGSITQNADPLYVVDGFPTPNFNLNSVDTKDIESVEVLKDAAATAVYGSRAANGVVIITTKGGSRDHKVHVDIEAYTGTQSAWKKLDLLNRSIPWLWHRTSHECGRQPAFAILKYESANLCRDKPNLC